MKNIALLLLCLSAVLWGKTWEANLRSCDGYGGFWFPNHDWTDKGEPWIKPFVESKHLEDYGEMGISFDFFKQSYLTAYNPFEMWWTPNQSKKVNNPIDSVYFFVTNCGVDSTQSYVCDKYLSLENLSMDDFDLIISKSYEQELDSPHEFSLDDFYNYETGMYFVYKKYSDKFEYSALCNMTRYEKGDGYSYEIQCEFQDDGSLNFKKIPDAKTVPEDFCSTQSISIKRSISDKRRNSVANHVFYRINGTPALKGSSNIILQNEKTMLQLKGN